MIIPSYVSDEMHDRVFRHRLLFALAENPDLELQEFYPELGEVMGMEYPIFCQIFLRAFR